MKHQLIQWLIGGCLLILAGVGGWAIYQAHRPQDDQVRLNDDVVRTHYREWQREHLVVADKMKFVATNKDHSRTLSEAQGYGMLITVMASGHGLATRRAFDDLTQYYLENRISAKNPLMAWRQTNKTGLMRSTAAEQTSATDGDLDIAYALILADERWGSNGSFDYQALAQQLIQAIKRREIDPTTQLPRVGDWATTGNSRHLIRTSDLMTAYFRKFASFTGDQSWSQVATNSQTVLRKLSQEHETGLMADFVTVRGERLEIGQVKPNQVATATDADYGYNACRVPWRTAYDYRLSKSRISRAVTEKMLRFFDQQTEITAVYKVTGQPVEQTINLAFTAPIAYAARELGNRRLIQRCTPLLVGPNDGAHYYPATLQMLMVLLSSEAGPDPAGTS